MSILFAAACAVLMLVLLIAYGWRIVKSERDHD